MFSFRPVDVAILEENALTADDLMLLCDLFYLPFEHGSRGLRLMHDFHWLTTHAASILQKGNKSEVNHSFNHSMLKFTS